MRYDARTPDRTLYYLGMLCLHANECTSAVLFQDVVCVHYSIYFDRLIRRILVLTLGLLEGRVVSVCLCVAVSECKQLHEIATTVSVVDNDVGVCFMPESLEEVFRSFSGDNPYYNEDFDY